MPLNARAKGKRVELKLVRYLKARGLFAHRSQQRKGTPDSPDVICKDLLPDHIECKGTEQLRAHPFLEKANEEAGKNRRPVVWWKKKRKPWVVFMYGHDYVKLRKEANGKQCNQDEVQRATFPLEDL